MACPRFALWLLARADRAGRREALVGDLLEEIALGRPRLWVWRQVVGLCGFALMAQARTCARVTPFVVALAVGAILVGGVWVASPGTVLETWIVAYLVAGTLSLFAHVMSRAIASRPLVIAADSRSAERS